VVENVSFDFLVPAWGPLRHVSIAVSVDDGKGADTTLRVVCLEGYSYPGARRYVARLVESICVALDQAGFPSSASEWFGVPPADA